MIADGGLATTLQLRGLPPFTPVDGWLRDRPDEIEAAHRAFLEAGATILVTATFTAAAEPDGEDLADRAAALARAAADGRAAIWGAIGPVADDERRRRIAIRLAPAVDGLLLETFPTAAACLAALGAVRSLPVPIVASLTVRPDGALYDGAPAAAAFRALLDAGADAIGLNCGEPAGIARALDTWDGPAAWVRPGRVAISPAAWTAATRALASRARVVGGCCGVTPAMTAALADEAPWTR